VGRQFDRYMVQIGIGTNRKLRRIPVAQRWAYVAGVLSLAAQSPMRGALLIADGEPVTDTDLAEEATIPVKDARAALASFRRLGMLEKDDQGVEWVHDWDSLNRDPKPSDSPEETRERKRRQRARERGSRSESETAPPPPRDTPAAVTRDSEESHDPEVEVEVEVEGEEEEKTEIPSLSYRGKSVPVETTARAVRLLEAFNKCAGRDLAAPVHPRQIAGALIDRPDVSMDEWERAVRNQVANPPAWLNGRPIQLGDIFGEKAIDHALANTGRKGDATDLTDQAVKQLVAELLPDAPPEDATFAIAQALRARNGNASRDQVVDHIRRWFPDLATELRQEATAA
jgi:hypothetical protein